MLTENYHIAFHNMKHIVGLFVIFLLNTQLQELSAQPDHGVHGCHYVKQQIPLKKLSPKQEKDLLKSRERSDSVDILDYTINLEIIDFANQRIDGNCQIQFIPIEADVQEVALDLLQLELSAVQLNGEHVAYTYDGNFIVIPLPEDLDTENPSEINIEYGGTPTVATSGFGGLDFDNGIAYNLGIGLGENPYNFGRSWFPCFDNFIERSTFSLNITTADGRKAYCSGLFISEEALSDGKIRRSYRIDQPMTTYLVGVAVSDYEVTYTSHQGQYGNYPIRLVAHPGDMGSMNVSFEYLGDAIDAFEAWYGPYIFEEVGFVLTPVGAMEHVNNVAFPRFSGVAGATDATNRLMAHELAHQWWGNITTLSSPANMWIKEGNAEYGAHLFTEYVFGEEEFKEQVKANHLFVLRNAHLDDDGFQPLSGIPYEQTYGTHTYNKGASMIHNMRAYMGDSLFSSAQSAVLNDFAFSAVDAEEYRDHLTDVSGIDMAPFFDAWIFNAGWSNFEKESMSVEAMGNEFEVTLTVQQRLRGTDQLHDQVPLSVTYFDANWQEYTTSFYASGELSTATMMVPFEPALAVLNHNQELNLGRVNEFYQLTEEGGINASAVDVFSINIEEIEAPALLNVVHHWTAPDPHAFPEQIKMSGTHYWTIDGIFSEDFSMKVIMRYAGGINDLDYDLVEENDDFIRLMYRSSPDEEWEEYPFVTYTPFGSGGLARMDVTLPGDYAFANVYEEVSVNNIMEEASLRLSPNPAQDVARLELDFPEASTDYELGVYDLNGRIVYAADYPQSPFLDVTLPTNNLPDGLYVLTITNGVGYRAVELVVQH